MGECNVVAILSMPDVVCLAYIMQKLWSALAVLDLYGMLEFRLCCEILLLLNMAEMVVSYVKDCRVSNADQCV